MSSTSSSVLNGVHVSFAARTGEPSLTSPEEMIATAHASCLAMALAHALEKAGFKPTELDVSASVSFEQRDGKWTITKSALDVVGSVPGLDENTLQRLATEAKETCPVSRALSSDVEVTISASLAPEQFAAAAGP